MSQQTTSTPAVPEWFAFDAADAAPFPWLLDRDCHDIANAHTGQIPFVVLSADQIDAKLRAMAAESHSPFKPIRLRGVLRLVRRSGAMHLNKPVYEIVEHRYEAGRPFVSVVRYPSGQYRIGITIKDGTHPIPAQFLLGQPVAKDAQNQLFLGGQQGLDGFIRDADGAMKAFPGPRDPHTSISQRGGVPTRTTRIGHADSQIATILPLIEEILRGVIDPVTEKPVLEPRVSLSQEDRQARWERRTAGSRQDPMEGPASRPVADVPTDAQVASLSPFPVA